MKQEKPGVRYVAPFDPLYDADGVQVSSGQDQYGRELPDPVPLSPPVGYRAPPTLADMIARMVRSELLNRAADLEEFDSFDEAEDFEIEDDPLDPHTPYEAVFDPPPAKPTQAVPDASKSEGSPNDGKSNPSSAANSGPTGANSGTGAIQPAETVPPAA